jgi:hypothetical protein
LKTVTNASVVFFFVLSCCLGSICAQDMPNLRDVPKVHQFRLWKAFDGTQKAIFLVGFTNGLLTGVGAKNTDRQGWSLRRSEQSKVASVEHLVGSFSQTADACSLKSWAICESPRVSLNSAVTFA